jgi:hypothetical protein
MCHRFAIDIFLLSYDLHEYRRNAACLHLFSILKPLFGPQGLTVQGWTSRPVMSLQMSVFACRA